MLRADLAGEVAAVDDSWKGNKTLDSTKERKMPHKRYRHREESEHRPGRRWPEPAELRSAALYRDRVFLEEDAVTSEPTRDQTGHNIGRRGRWPHLSALDLGRPEPPQSTDR